MFSFQDTFIFILFLTDNTLTFEIEKKKNYIQEKETLDPFVKVSLLCGDKRVKKKKKTAVRKATTSPVWNEAMSFNVPASSLATSAIEVCNINF